MYFIYKNLHNCTNIVWYNSLTIKNEMYSFFMSWWLSKNLTALEKSCSSHCPCEQYNWNFLQDAILSKICNDISSECYWYYFILYM